MEPLKNRFRLTELQLQIDPNFSTIDCEQAPI